MTIEIITSLDDAVGIAGAIGRGQDAIMISEPGLTSEPIPVVCYSELIGAIRDQVGALGVKYTDFDVLAGFAEGLSGKTFGPAMVKRLGPEKLFDALRAAGLRLKVEEDPEQVAKMRKWIAENFNPRQANQARPRNEASPAGRHMMGRVFRHFAKQGGLARMRKMTKAQRTEHQRNAAMARWKKSRKRQRTNEGASL